MKPKNDSTAPSRSTKPAAPPRETPLTRLLKARMAELDNLTQWDLAKRLKVGQGLISQVLSGKRVVPPKNQVKWARALRLEPGTRERRDFDDAVRSALAHAKVRGHDYVADLERENLTLKTELEVLRTRLAIIQGGAT